MKLIWILGGDENFRTRLEAVLVPERFPETEYVIRQIDKASELPPEKMQSPGTVVLLDAFNAAYPGFNGLEELHTSGYKGATFLFGEPAPENAVVSFRDLSLTGYFPSVDQCDFDFVGGVLHYHFNYNGKVTLKHFLAKGGRSAKDTINTTQDFNAFGLKLARFVGKFGVDIAQLKKVLMGLTLGHVKTGEGAPQVESPFEVHYGMDPNKVLLAASTYSRGANRDAVRSDFVELVKGMQDEKALPGTIFPEVYHVGRAARNLTVLSGSAERETETLDPIFLLTALSFPKTKEQAQAPFSVFCFSTSKPASDEEMVKDRVQKDSDNLDEVEAKSENEVSAEHEESADNLDHVEADTDVDGNDGNSGDGDKTSDTEVGAEAPQGMIQDFDLEGILDEPEIIGDQPVFADPDNPDSWESTSQSDEAESNDESQLDENSVRIDSDELAGLKEDLDRVRRLNTALSEDVKRLMKERRQPSTDKELKSAVAKLEDRLKNAKLDKERMGKLIDEVKEEKVQLAAEIETLQAQLEAIKRSGKAA